MTEEGRRLFYVFKWRSALLASLCLAVFISGGSLSFGRPLSESDNPPQPGLVQPPTNDAADFSLCAFPANTAGLNGYGAGGIELSLQKQPFVEKSVRLRDDDPEYYTKSAVYTVVLRVLASNVLTWAIDRFVFNYDFSHIGPKSWSHNLKTGMEWDTDRLGMNFFFHPYTGGAYFNSARANGYNFFESLPFPLLGSLVWEYFGENTKPSYNDVINTTLSGILFGEILYRLSSDLLDDQTTGAERFFRELGAFILDPGRAISRLLQGKSWRVTPKEIYQKEPLKFSLYAGAHAFNKGSTFMTGSLSGVLNIHLEYGDPYEIRDRKPFDFFKLWIDLNYGKNVGANYLNNVTAYGLLFGKTIHSGDFDVLIGAFQHYNFWDSKVFELSALGLGGGILAKWRLSENSDIQTAFLLGIVPLAASNSPYIDLVAEGVQARDYDYDTGVDAKFEGSLNLAKRVQLTVIDYLYGLHVVVGPAGNKIINIFRPRIAVRLISNLSLGFEYSYYQKASYLKYYPDVRKSDSEQKLYLMLYF